MIRIPLSQGKFALVDIADLPMIAKYKWHANKHHHTWYAEAHTRKPDGRDTIVRMHRIITGATDRKIEVDHIDGDGLNNRRKNMRLCSHIQNRRNTKKPRNNTSGYKGVYQHTQTGKWIATVSIDGKAKNLGSFETPELAYGAYCAAAKKHYGEFARIE